MQKRIRNDQVWHMLRNHTNIVQLKSRITEHFDISMTSDFMSIIDWGQKSKYIPFPES